MPNVMSFISHIPQNSNAKNLFSFNGAEVTVTTREGEPWFVLHEVCKILEIENVGNASSRLDDDEKTTIRNTDSQAGSGAQLYTIINESGLYSLILRSRKPEAKQFKKWVTAEVLPSIRKTGGYLTVKEDDTPETLMARALFIAKDTIDRQKEQIEQMQPKALAHDRLMDAEGTLCMRDAAKALQVGQNQLIDWLHEHGWIHRRQGKKNWIAYADKMISGYLKHKITEVGKDELGDPRIREQVRITPKGLSRLAHVFSNPTT